MTVRAQAIGARTVVVKLGSAVLTGGGPVLDRAYLYDIAAQIGRARAGGRRLIVVSSGAVAAGLAPLGLSARPSDVAGQQAAAAAGQPLLMSLWGEALSVRGTPAAQVLLSRADFDSRDRFLNIRNCLTRLLEMGAVPVVNENDTVATEEISLGDNDLLSAKIAAAVQADLLVILTGVGGVLDESGRVIAHALGADSLSRFVRAEKSTQGRGGMASKLAAARAAGLKGSSVVIAPGRPAESLGRVLAGETVGTLITPPAEARVAGRRLWIGVGVTPSGSVSVDAGAERALRERGASLLARGVTSVAGAFEVGDVVTVVSAGGSEIARGLINFSSAEAARIVGLESSRFEDVLGRQAHEEVIHRDNLVLTDARGEQRADAPRTGGVGP